MANRAEYTSGAIAFDMRVEGLTESVAMLEQLPKTMVLAGFAAGLKAASEVFCAELDLNIPVRSMETPGGDLQPHELRSRLTYRITLDTNYRGGVAEIGFGPAGYVANFIEYGHWMVSHDKQNVLAGPNTPGGFVPANPFMRRSFDAGKERAIDAFVGAVQNTVRQYQAGTSLPTAA